MDRFLMVLLLSVNSQANNNRFGLRFRNIPTPLTTIETQAGINVMRMDENNRNTIILGRDTDLVAYNKINGTIKSIAGDVTEMGYQDGIGSEIRVNIITGLVILSGKYIITDRLNDCIRTIDMGSHFSETLAGKCDEPLTESLDGDFESCVFVSPLAVEAYISDESYLLFVLQPDAVRKVDLKNGGVTTIPSNFHGLTAMTQIPNTNNFFITFIDGILLLNGTKYTEIIGNNGTQSLDEYGVTLTDTHFTQLDAVAYIHPEILLVRERSSDGLKIVDMQACMVSSICKTNEIISGIENCQIENDGAILIDTKERQLLIGQRISGVNIVQTLRYEPSVAKLHMSLTHQSNTRLLNHRVTNVKANTVYRLNCNMMAMTSGTYTLKLYMGGELVVTSTEISNTSPTFHNISMNARWTLVDAVYANKLPLLCEAELENGTGLGLTNFSSIKAILKIDDNCTRLDYSPDIPSEEFTGLVSHPDIESTNSTREYCEQYLQKANPCADAGRPCLHGGTCTAPGAFCACTEGFFGKHCEDINRCGESGVQCLNGGECHPDFEIRGTFPCTCREGFFGYTCSLIERCVPNPCPVPWQICVEDYTRAGGFICKENPIINHQKSSGILCVYDKECEHVSGSICGLDGSCVCPGDTIVVAKTQSGQLQKHCEEAIVMCQQQQDCLWLTGGGVDRFCKLRFETGKCLCTDESRMNNKTGACYAEQESMIAIWKRLPLWGWFLLAVFAKLLFIISYFLLCHWRRAMREASAFRLAGGSRFRISENASKVQLNQSKVKSNQADMTPQEDAVVTLHGSQYNLRISKNKLMASSALDYNSLHSVTTQTRSQVLPSTNIKKSISLSIKGSKGTRKSILTLASTRTKRYDFASLVFQLIKEELPQTPKHKWRTVSHTLMRKVRTEDQKRKSVTLTLPTKGLSKNGKPSKDKWEDPAQDSNENKQLFALKPIILPTDNALGITNTPPFKANRTSKKIRRPKAQPVYSQPDEVNTETSKDDSKTKPLSKKSSKLKPSSWTELNDPK